MQKVVFVPGAKLGSELTEFHFILPFAVAYERNNYIYKAEKVITGDGLCEFRVTWVDRGGFKQEVFYTEEAVRRFLAEGRWLLFGVMRIFII